MNNTFGKSVKIEGLKIGDIVRAGSGRFVVARIWRHRNGQVYVDLRGEGFRFHTPLVNVLAQLEKKA